MVHEGTGEGQWGNTQKCRDVYMGKRTFAGLYSYNAIHLLMLLGIFYDWQVIFGSSFQSLSYCSISSSTLFVKQILC